LTICVDNCYLTSLDIYYLSDPLSYSMILTEIMLARPSSRFRAASVLQIRARLRLANIGYSPISIPRCGAPTKNDRNRCINDYLRLGAPAASLSWPDPAEPGSPATLSDGAQVPPGDRSVTGVSSQAKSAPAIRRLPISRASHFTQRLTVYRCLYCPARNYPELIIYVWQSRLFEKLSFYHCFSSNSKRTRHLRTSRTSRCALTEKLSFYHCFSSNSKRTRHLRTSRTSRSALPEKLSFYHCFDLTRHKMPSCATPSTTLGAICQGLKPYGISRHPRRCSHIPQLLPMLCSSSLQTQGALPRPVVHRYNDGLSIDDRPRDMAPSRTTTNNDKGETSA
jgi:hypothetical protein